MISVSILSITTILFSGVLVLPIKSKDMPRVGEISYWCSLNLTLLLVFSIARSCSSWFRASSSWMTIPSLLVTKIHDGGVIIAVHNYGCLDAVTVVYLYLTAPYLSVSLALGIRLDRLMSILGLVLVSELSLSPISDDMELVLV